MKNSKLQFLVNSIVLLVLLSFFYLNANAQTVKLYPSTLRITKGKSNTATAIYRNSMGVHTNEPFSFSTSNSAVATATNDIAETGFSNNLASIKALNAGTANVTATSNGLTSNPITVIVDDPTATPIAEIHGDNDASGGLTITTKIGEPIEINAESSQGVASVEWEWGDGDKAVDVLSSTHSYLQAATYVLTLKIKNSSGVIATDTVNITVQNFSNPTNTFTVTTQQQLIDAYNQCTGGEHIVIPAGTTILGHIELPNRNLSDYVTIRSSGTMPDIRDRISPNSSQIATLKGVNYNVPTLKIKNNASKIRFIGIRFEPLQQANYDQFTIIEVGDFSQTSYSTNPQKIIFQHSIMNPPDDTQVRHGMLNDGYKVAVISSWFGNIQTRCFPEGCVTDSNAAYSLNGKGSHVYNNSYIEASSENILYGGDNLSVDGGVPTNVEIRRCYFYKRLAWKPNPTPLYNIKNLIEFKIGRRVYLEGNIFENHWIGTEAGQSSAININSIAESNSPWTVNEDIVFENNKVIQMPSGVLLASNNGTDVTGYDARKSNNIRFKNMLFDKFNIGEARRLLIANTVEDALFDRVTQIDINLATSRLMDFATRNNYRLQITNSIVGMGTDYQIFFNGLYGRCALNYGTGGSNTVSPCNPDGSWNVSSNIFVRYNSNPIINPPANNCDTPVGFNSVGFVDLANGDYRLSSTRSCYQGQLDPGADIPLLNQRTACTVSGIGTNCSGPPTTQTPYPGPNAPTIPSTLEVENFDRGGQGVAYNDTFGTTGSGAYRVNPVEAVDIQAQSNASNGYSVFEAATGEWLEYTINVPASGLYNFNVRYSSGYSQPLSQGQFRLEVCEPAPNNGVTNCISSGSITVNSTGGWNTFQTISSAINVPSSGTRILRLIMVTNAPGDTNCNCVVANFDSITISKGQTLFDYDADGKADVSVFRPSDGNWYLSQSSAGFTAVSFGASTDVITPADYDGDGKTDVAVFRPSNGAWYLQRSSLGFIGITLGQNGDIPVQADYDGDGKADVAVFQPSNGTWYYIKSSDGVFSSAQFGAQGDKPAVGDYDGDGKADFAVFRPLDNIWYLQRSQLGFAAVQLGSSTDKITPADYDGDGKTDVAVYRPSNGTWYRFNSSDNAFVAFQFGDMSDIPVPADYDGDGKADIAVFRPSNGVWYLQRSLLGFIGIAFGQNDDVPTPSTYVR